MCGAPALVQKPFRSKTKYRWDTTMLPRAGSACCSFVRLEKKLGMNSGWQAVMFASEQKFWLILFWTEPKVCHTTRFELRPM